MIESIGRFGQPKRLRQVVPAGSPLARGLVFARERQPSSDEARALEAGLFAALGAGAVAAAVGTTIARSVPAAASTTSAAASLALKATLVLALGAGGGALGVRWLRTGPHQPVVPVPTTAAPALRAPVAPSLPPGAPAAEPAAPAAPSVAEHPRRPSRVRVADRHAPPAAPVPSLQAELQLIESARAVVISDPARALQLCGEHARAYPTGVMAEERDAITVTALVALDRVPEARASLAAFRRRYPASPQTARLDERLRAFDTAR